MKKWCNIDIIYEEIIKCWHNIWRNNAILNNIRRNNAILNNINRNDAMLIYNKKRCYNIDIIWKKYEIVYITCEEMFQYYYNMWRIIAILL